LTARIPLTDGNAKGKGIQGYSQDHQLQVDQALTSGYVT
jgi:hypothetical protein